MCLKFVYLYPSIDIYLRIRTYLCFLCLLASVVIAVVFRDFISPQTIRIEFGISHEMEQYDKNFKLRHLLGDAEPVTPGGGGSHTVVRPVSALSMRFGGRKKSNQT